MLNLLWWSVAVILMAIGLLGAVLPVIPGTTIILAAAVGHRILAGPENGVGIWGIVVLVALALVSYGLDFLSGYFGARYFGATKWGVAGAVIGGIVGIFTGFVTLLFAPVIGAIIGEVIGGKRLISAGKAGWGTLLGNLAGMVAKLLIALAMIIVFLMNARAPFS